MRVLASASICHGRKAAAWKAYPRRVHPAEICRAAEKDDAQVRRLIKTLLEKQGYQVFEARDGTAAQGIAADHAGPVHLLLTDVVMPGLSGKQIAKILRAERPEMKVLFISGYTGESIAQHGMTEEGMALMSKPVLPSALARKVRDVLDS
jgi:DNA-binding response OmpR family regulator